MGVLPPGPGLEGGEYISSARLFISTSHTLRKINPPTENLKERLKKNYLIQNIHPQMVLVFLVIQSEMSTVLR